MIDKSRHPNGSDGETAPDMDRRRKAHHTGGVDTAGPVPPVAGKKRTARFWNWFCFGLCAGWLSILLSGCRPSAPGQSSDEREPHYVLGEHRVDAMDYRGAIRAFEESLQVDPHSAAAHFQLGWLYDAKLRDPVAAIYHYEQYLKLDPHAGNAAVVRQRIEACKQALAADVLGLPSMPAAQQRVEQLMAKNEQLRNEIRQLQKANQQLRTDVNRWSAYCASLSAARINPPPVAAQAAHKTDAAQLMVAHRDERAGPALGMKAAGQTHVVIAGETAVGIARHYGISLPALLAANPGLEPRRMPVGLILNIPPPVHDSALPLLEARR